MKLLLTRRRDYKSITGTSLAVSDILNFWKTLAPNMRDIIQLERVTTSTKSYNV